MPQANQSYPIRNMGLIKVTWNDITFHCTAKSLPTMKDSPSWSIVTDNTNELTARTIVGKPAGFEPIELTIETEATLVYQSLLEAMTNGVAAPATFCYSTGTANAMTVTVANCSLCGLTVTGGANNSASTTTVKLQPEGGDSNNLPTVTNG